MDQSAIGSYIAQKRKLKNLTQEQLGELLSVSNKTISKWENGKCMPDYSVIQRLCDALSISLPELMNGADAHQPQPHDDAQLLELLRRTQELERQKNILYGLILIVMGIATNAMSGSMGGSDMRDFLSGIFMGLSIAMMLGGIFLVGKHLRQKA